MGKGSLATMARRTFQEYLEIQKAEFLVFLRTRVVQQYLEVLKEQAASIFFFSMNAMRMSRESEILFMYRTTMHEENNPIMLRLITWLQAFGKNNLSKDYPW